MTDRMYEVMAAVDDYVDAAVQQPNSAWEDKGRAAVEQAVARLVLRELRYEYTPRIDYWRALAGEPQTGGAG